MNPVAVDAAGLDQLVPVRHFLEFTESVDEVNLGVFLVQYPVTEVDNALVDTLVAVGFGADVDGGQHLLQLSAGTLADQQYRAQALPDKGPV